jgi:beta-lactam-binding protein with PASTA domain
VDTPAGPVRTIFRRLALALLLAAWPVAAGAQDTAGAPTASTPRVSLPAGSTIARPPQTAPTTVARPPATNQQPQQQPAIVPDLSGRTVDQARRLLAAAGLEVGRVAEGQGSGTPGTIIQQQPRAGSAVAPKSTVQLWLAPEATAATPPPVSRPPVTRPPAPSIVTVPRLAGRTVDDARATLARVSLVVGDVGEAAGTGAPGTIVRQSPRPGFPVVRGSAVQVWVVPARVAQQPRNPLPDPMVVRVPNLVGQTVEDARETLSAAGLTLGSLAEGSGTGVPGTVTRQQPAAGSAMLPNSRVGVWLVPAARPPAAGGQVATRPDPSPPARPQPQPPAQPAQTPAAQNSVVPNPPAAAPAVPVPAATDSIAVPDVRRLALAEAQVSLAAAGYTAVFDTALADSAGWMVTAQQPGPGARLASGGLVALLLDPPAPVAAAPPAQPPLATGTQQGAVPPATPRAETGRRTLWISLAAVLLILAAAAAWRMRARSSVPPIAGVSARFRTDAPARVAVEGMPFGDARLRFRVNPGRTVARVAADGPLFVSKEVSGD